MLSNNLKKTSSILSRRCFHRCLASAAAAPPTLQSKSSVKDSSNNKVNNNNIKTLDPTPPKPSAPRGFPTRHSRHSEPLVAPVETLDESCQRIIASTPGTLFCKWLWLVYYTLYDIYHSMQRMLIYSICLPFNLISFYPSPSSVINTMHIYWWIHQCIIPHTLPHHNSLQLQKSAPEQDGRIRTGTLRMPCTPTKNRIPPSRILRSATEIPRPSDIGIPFFQQ